MLEIKFKQLHIFQVTSINFKQFQKSRIEFQQPYFGKRF